MKNIHILQTDKPSILIKDLWKNTFSLVEDFDTNHTDFKPQNIYITNDEEIEEGDWHYNLALNSVEKTTNFDNGLLQEKIIITTDQDLIKDGVQAIEDEFLEWFVKNPSCEFVKTLWTIPAYKIKKEYRIEIQQEEPKLSNICIKCGVDLYATEGKFICQKHPKECKGIYLSKETLLTHAAEQKQHLIDMMKSDEELGLYDEPKQETTLGEATERFYGEEEIVNDYDISGYLQSAFLTGAKWQQERSYSEEEVLDLLRNFYSSFDPIKNPPHTRTIPLWFEQFKKK